MNDMALQLRLQKRDEIAVALEKCCPQINRIIKGHPKEAHGFFFAHDLAGHVLLNIAVEAYCVMGMTFHVRPLLEEFFTNPEFMVVNVSLYDIKVYKGDFQHIEIVQHYEFDQLPKGFMDMPSSRFYTPQYLGLLPYKTLLALKTIAQKIQDLVLYNSLPVIVTGLAEVKEIFLRYFDRISGVIAGVHEDFYEKTCMQILESCRSLRPLVLDYYSGQFRDQLKKMIQSKRLITDLDVIIKEVNAGKVVHLVLPQGGQLWGDYDPVSGSFSLHKKNRPSSVDILSILAEEVMRQGGRIQFLGAHFFSQDSYVLAIRRGHS